MQRRKMFRMNVLSTAIAAAVAWAAIAMALGSAAGLSPTALAQDPPTATATPVPSTCVADAQKWAWPHTVQLGETVQITLTAKAVCPQSLIPLHVALVLDGSGTMAGDPRQQMVDATKQLVDRLDLQNNPGTKVGVVEFNASARTLCMLSNTASQVKACISRVGAEGGSDIAAGILEGLRVLLNGRRDLIGGGQVNEVMVVLSDGSNNAGCNPVLQASRQAKSQGILMITVCIGPGCDSQCMRQAALSSRYFFEIDQADALVAVFDRIRDDISRSIIRTMTIVDRIPPNMALVPGSVVPAAEVSPDGMTLTWRTNFVPKDGMTMTFRVRPLEPGYHPTNVEAVGDFRDSVDGVGRFVFPVPFVQVFGAPVALTPTPAPGPPAARSSLSLFPATLRTGERARVAYHLEFDPPTLPQDSHVAIVADASGSMTGEHNTKLKDALRALVDDFEATGSALWKAAVIEFNSIAKIPCPLTRDVADLKRCINLIPASGGTRIDLGISAGLDALRNGRPSPGHEDLVLFTDGANSAGCEPVLTAARAAKAEGAEVHVVCMGANGCDTMCMRQAASSPRHYHEIADLAGYDAAFAAVSDQIVGDRRIAALDIALTVPSHLRLVPDSWTRPVASSGARSARWTLDAMPRGGLDLWFEVDAVTDGADPIAMTADVGFTRHPAARVDAISGPVVVGTGATPTMVSGNTATATSTATAPTPTREPGPTATSKIGQPDPVRIFLPVALRERCPDIVSADLVVVLDTSNSMAERAADGGSKIDAATAAVEVLAAGLLPGDRLAMVTFDRTARVAAPLHADPAAVRSVLRSLGLDEGTAIDAGLRTAREVLATGAATRARDTRPTIVLLTDGRATPSAPAAAAIAEANLAKAEGTTIFAFGLGQEVDARTLAAIASRPEYVKLTTGRDEVVAAFQSLVDRCGEGMFGGR